MRFPARDALDKFAESGTHSPSELGGRNCSEMVSMYLDSGAALKIRAVNRIWISVRAGQEAIV